MYLDKDTLITLSKHMFTVAGQPLDCSSDFFEQHIRNPEYDCIVALALEASIKEVLDILEDNV